MPCTPKKTVQLLREAGAQGLFAAKLNQRSLLKACQRRSRFPVTDTHRSVEKPHGIVVERVTQTWPFRPKDLPARWRGDQRIPLKPDFQLSEVKFCGMLFLSPIFHLHNYWKWNED